MKMMNLNIEKKDWRAYLQKRPIIHSKTQIDRCLTTGNFRRCVFFIVTDSQRVEFKIATDFAEAKFGAEADFEEAEFSNQLTDFTKAQFVRALNLNIVQSIHLHLHQTQMDMIYCDTQCAFTTPSRETFLVLKNIAIKRHNKIKALEFHTQEYQQHLATLKWKKNFSDKLILQFEEWASRFGTSVGRSVSILLGFMVFFYLYMNDSDWDAGTITNFIIHTTTSIDDLLISSNPDSIAYILFAFYKIGQIILIYEIIIPFRKYS